jgi:nitrous oxidase accessory protein NosD
MNFKKLAVLSALTFAVFLALMTFGGRITRAAGPWFVNATTGNDANNCLTLATACKTIQAAINKASAGDTINVAAGTYNEHVQIDKTLTLKGAQAGVDARTRVPASESIINNTCGPVQILADNVVLDGFTMQGANDASSGCTFAGIWTNPGFSGTQGGHQILNNIVQNNISGIELDNTGTFPTKVQFNLIQNNNNPGPGPGNAIQVNFGLNNALIDNNRFSGHDSSSILVVAPSSGLAVSNNALVGGTPEGIAFINVSSSTIAGNTSVGSTSSATIDLFGGNNGITVTCNTLAAGQRGIRVDNPYAVYGVLPNSNITANTNNIQGNVIAGLEVETGSYFGGSLNATNNWWGSSTGPTHASNFGGTGDKIIDPDGAVTFIPFLTSPSPCAPVPDLCPADPNKTEPGVCGCGVPDTDTDADGTPNCHDACPTDPNKIAPGACGCGLAETPGCTTTKKDCEKYVEQQKKDFEEMQKAQKKTFEDNQKAAKQTFDSQPHSKQEKKDFEEMQKTQKKTFEDNQKTAKDNFEQQNKANKEQCKTLPKD